MSFISEFVEKIWEDKSKEYYSSFNAAMDISEHDLYESLCNEKTSLIKYEKSNMNIYPTCGCNHRISDGKKLSGCSMCDYHSNDIEVSAKFSALRKKNADLYSKAIRKSIEKAREKAEPMPIEEWMGADNCCCNEECPEVLYQEIFNADGPLKKRPFRYIFEARASSITYNKLMTIKKYTGKAKVKIDLGTEVGNEWIRNYWLNKNITNKEIENAINIIHSVGFSSCGNVLLGIPGMTEEQSIDIFVETIRWINDLGIKHISVYPLEMKQVSMQGFLSHRMKLNKVLSEVGIVNGGHTGLPWLFTVVEALSRVLEENLDIASILGVGIYNTNNNFERSGIAFNKNTSCKCFSKILNALEEFNMKKDPNILFDVRKNMINDPCYKDYERLKEKQKNVGGILETVKLVGSEFAKTLWSECWKQKVLLLQNDLQYENMKESKL